MIDLRRPLIGFSSLVLLASVTLGSSTIASGQELAYVTSNFGDPLTVISTSDKSVVDSLALGLSQRGVAVHPNGQLLYVMYSGFVDVIETAGYTRVSLVQLEAGSRNIVLSPDGLFAYVTNMDARTVSVFDTQTNTVVASVPVQLSPTGIALTPDGKFAYVSNSDTRVVSVIDTETRTVTAEVTVGVSPANLAVSPDGSLVYVPSESEDVVSVIQTSDNVVKHSFGLGGQPTAVAFSPDGEHLYAVSAISNNVTIFDVGPDTVLAQIDIGAANHRDIAVASDGKSVYVPNLSAESVSIIAFGADTTVTMVDVGRSPSSVAIGIRVDVTATEPSELPDSRLSLEAGFPNPFSEITQIAYSVSDPGQAALQIFDVTGRLIRNVELGFAASGAHRTQWDGRNDAGSAAPAGVYFVSLRVGERVQTGAVTKAVN